MDPLTESQIRESFVNASKGETKRANLPADLGEARWEDLDFLGWVDPRAPLQAYLVMPSDDGPVGVQLRRNTAGSGPRRAKMCSLCLTTHSGQGVSLMVARRAGQAGREGNTVGLDICAGLECSLYVRSILPLPTMSTAHETLTTDERIARLHANLQAFVARVQRST